MAQTSFLLFIGWYCIKITVAMKVGTCAINAFIIAFNCAVVLVAMAVCLAWRVADEEGNEEW